ncbi:MAG: hypothetical protein GY737_24205 [Desulfobacteraceae bacterium]|nr:hypothetical protein [Desulfobacteraceae bacterium]
MAIKNSTNRQIETAPIIQELAELIISNMERMTIDGSQLSIKHLFSPDRIKQNHFGVVILQNNCAGITYTALSDEFEKASEELDQHEFIGESALHLLKNLIKHERTAQEEMICMGLINALSDTIMKHRTPDPRNYQMDSLASLKLQAGDHVGMVGFFPPVVKKIEEKKIPLTIIEKKKELLRKSPHWQVTLDPQKLTECNKVIITATTVLNNSLDHILSFCGNADLRILIGPTAGFLPEPLLARKINVIGGSMVKDPYQLIERLKKDEKWGDAVKKYCIRHL